MSNKGLNSLLNLDFSEMFAVWMAQLLLCPWFLCLSAAEALKFLWKYWRFQTLDAYLWTYTSGPIPLGAYLWTDTSGRIPLDAYLWTDTSGQYYYCTVAVG